MKKLTSSIVLLFLLFLTSDIHAQSEVGPAKHQVKVSYIYLQAGKHVQDDYGALLHNMADYFPGSGIGADTSGYLTEFAGGTNRGPAFAVSIGLDLGLLQTCALTLFPELRVGVNFMPARTVTSVHSKESLIGVDSLTSNSTGEQVLLDHVTQKSYSSHYRGQQVGAEAALILRSNPEAWLSVHFGVGVLGGASVQSKTSVYTSDGENFQVNNTEEIPGFLNGYGPEPSTSFHKRNFDMSYSAAIYTPVGVTLRLNKRIPVLSRIALQYEFQPMLNYSTIPNLTSGFGYASQHKAGIRIRL